MTGMIFVELEEYFGASTTYVSLLCSIKMGLVLFLGTKIMCSSNVDKKALSVHRIIVAV